MTAAHFEAFFRNSSDPMAVVDAELRLIAANPAFVRDLAPILEGQSLVEKVCPSRDRELVRTALLESRQSGGRSFEASIIQANEQTRVGEWAASQGATSERLLVVVRKGVGRGRLEKELAEAQKLEAVGQLSSGIAHELNTPIQFVGDNLSFIGEALGELVPLLHALEAHPPSRELLTGRPELDLAFLLEELPRAVGNACEGVQRVAELVRGLKEFAHQDRGEVTPTDINRALERTLTVARNEWKYAADVETSFQDVPQVPCQASAIRQVFLNLICNAAQANGERNEKTGRQKGSIRVATSADDYAVTISISDTGTGIAESARSRIFEPFFTTKPVGKGTGQGLAISHAIVCEKHGGLIDFETELGVGTTFHVRLPLRPKTHHSEQREVLKHAAP